MLGKIGYGRTPICYKPTSRSGNDSRGGQTCARAYGSAAYMPAARSRWNTVRSIAITDCTVALFTNPARTAAYAAVSVYPSHIRLACTGESAHSAQRNRQGELRGSTVQDMAVLKVAGDNCKSSMEWLRLSRPMMRALRYCDDATCSTLFSVDLHGYER